MRFVPKMNGVECGETMWKYSPKSWGIHPLQNFLKASALSGRFFIHINKKVPTGMLLPEGTFFI